MGFPTQTHIAVQLFTMDHDNICKQRKCDLKFATSNYSLSPLDLAYFIIDVYAIP